MCARRAPPASRPAGLSPPCRARRGGSACRGPRRALSAAWGTGRGRRGWRNVAPRPSAVEASPPGGGGGRRSGSPGCRAEVTLRGAGPWAGRRGRLRGQVFPGRGGQRQELVPRPPIRREELSLERRGRQRALARLRCASECKPRASYSASRLWSCPSQTFL